MKLSFFEMGPGKYVNQSVWEQDDSVLDPIYKTVQDIFYLSSHLKMIIGT